MNTMIIRNHEPQNYMKCVICKISLSVPLNYFYVYMYVSLFTNYQYRQFLIVYSIQFAHPADHWNDMASQPILLPTLSVGGRK